MAVKIIQDEREFSALEGSWKSLTEHLPPINGFEWQFKWWKSHHHGNQLRILVAESDQGVEGIAPLFIQRLQAFKFVPVRQLGFVGGSITDYLDFLIRPGPNREETFRSLLDFMMKLPDVDEISLSQMNSSYPNFDLWQKYCRREGLDLVPYRECPRTHLAGFADFADYFHKLKKNHKKSLKLRQNEIAREAPSHRYVFKSRIEEADIAVLSRLNIERQKQLYEKGDDDRFSYFADPDNLAFIVDFFCSDQPRQKMVAYLLIGQDVVSYILFLQDEKSLFFWNTAFDPLYGKYSPTKLLIHESIKYAFEHHYEYFDFMRGKDPYKYNWTNEIAQCFSLAIPRSLKSKTIRGLRKIKPESILGRFKKTRSAALFSDKNE